MKLLFIFAAGVLIAMAGAFVYMAWLGLFRVRHPAISYEKIKARAARQGLNPGALASDPQQVEQTIRRQGYVFLVAGVVGIVLALVAAAFMIWLGFWLRDIEAGVAQTVVG